MRDYVGTGPLAELAAELDAAERATRMAKRQAQLVEEERWTSIETSVGNLYDAADLMAEAALVLAGYHQHDRGEWRKRRAAQRSEQAGK